MSDSISRSKNIKKNILYSICFKAVGIILSFLLLPLTVHYLTEVEYGVWVTVFSVMNWVNVMDMGIGLGLRNKLAEAVARDDILSIKEYISTGFVSISIMGLLIYLVFQILLNNANLQALYNTNLLSEKELYEVTIFTGTFVILAFVLSIINQIYYAYQKAAVTGAVNIVHNLIMLLIVYYLTNQSEHKLLYFVYSFGIAMIVSRTVFVFDFFIRRKDLIPSWAFFKVEKIKDISSIGIKFFIIQLCTILGYSFNNLLITKLVGPEYVRTYDIIFKVLNMSLMIQTLLIAPLWSAYTEAYVKKDYKWIKKAFWKSICVTTLISLFFAMIALFVNDIIYLWMHIELSYNSALVPLIWSYNVMVLYNNAFCMVLNGVGKIDIQMYTWIITATLIVPLSYYFVHECGMKSEGIALAMTLSICLLVFTLPLQLKSLFKQWT